MIISRFLQLNERFEDVRIMGMPGPLFHSISSFVFAALMLGTVVDWIRCWWATRGGTSKPI